MPVTLSLRPVSAEGGQRASAYSTTSQTLTSHDHSVKRQLLQRARAASIGVAAEPIGLMIGALLPQAATLAGSQKYSRASLPSGTPHRFSIVKPGSDCSGAFTRRPMSQARGRRTPPASPFELYCCAADVQRRAQPSPFSPKATFKLPAGSQPHSMPGMGHKTVTRAAPRALLYKTCAYGTAQHAVQAFEARTSGGRALTC